MKRMFLRTFLAVVPAVLLPLSAASQVTPATSEASAPAAQAQPPSYKYEAYVGFGYTSLNQVNQSRYGLLGVDLSVTRDWGRYFGMSVMGNYYKPSAGGGSSTIAGNPGDPSIYEVLAGPEIHASIYGNFSGFLHGGLGIEHTGGENMTPNISFAGGFGGGMSYNLSPRIAIRASGDKIGASFSLRNNTPALAYSPHRTWNSSGTIGVVVRF
ncbi:MAG TPA: hypothetical protein VFB43_02465 [Terracidiphilus sp.]|nr:hypothetical protein [Terracidiphilus sp.]